jgi:hypothetical protein
MKKLKKSKIQKFSAIFFCFAVLSQNSVESPVLCLETDGNINIESNCNTDCDIPNDVGLQDDCGECVDVQLWETNANTVYFAKSLDFNSISDCVFSDFIIFGIVHPISFVFQTKESYQENFPPFLKNTILLI